MSTNHWATIPLKSLGEFRNGVNFDKSKKGVGEIGLINVKDIFADIPRIDFEALDKVDLANEKGIERFYVQSGDLFFVRSSVKRDGVGLVSMSDHDNNKAIHCGFVIRFRPDSSKVNSRFLAYLLRSPLYRQKIIGISGGSAIINVSQDTLGNLAIDIPPIATQERIANVISTYDELILNNVRRISILEQMAQALYQEWFGKVDKESLPKGWEVKTLGDIAQEIRRNVHPNDLDPETPYFGLEHLPRKSIALSEWGKAGDVQSTKLAFKKGEILFGKIRPYFHKVGVAPLDGVASSDTIIITPKSPEYFGHVLSYIFSQEFVNHATRTSQGTKMPRANWGVLVKYPIIIPPKPILEQFNQTINDFVSLIQNLLFRNRNLRQTRDLLLPRLVSGEIDMSSLS